MVRRVLNDDIWQQLKTTMRAVTLPRLDNQMPNFICHSYFSIIGLTRAISGYSNVSSKSMVIHGRLETTLNDP